MERRSFIISLFGASLVIGIPWWGCQGDNTPYRMLATPDILSKITNEEMVRQIGEAYLQQFPEESNRDRLSDLLLKDSGLKLSAVNKQGEKVRTHLEQNVQRDFQEGRMMTLKGWILSETECRQCALFQLAFY